jgi:mRNA interferase MazF
VVIKQGDVYWVDLGGPSASGRAAVHPYVIVQNNLFNKSRINSVVVCELTSNLKRAAAPGNVLLKQGEGSLPKRSVVNVSQVHTVLKEDLAEKIGSLSSARLAQVLAGIDLVLKPRDVETR